MLPERALGADQSGRFVLVVGRDNRVEQRTVKPGDRTDDGLRMILEGLTADDLVVIDGLQYARPGPPVVPHRLDPSALLAPAAPTGPGDEPAAKKGAAPGETKEATPPAAKKEATTPAAGPAAG